MPVSTPSTVSRITEMVFHTPSNTGASTSQKPFQIAFRVSVISEKLMPRSANRSLIPSMKAEILALIFSQVAMIASRNPSFVFHRCTNAAARAATAAMTAMTGADMPPNAAPSFPNSPEAPDTAVPSFCAPAASLTNPCMAIPTLEITVPMITSNGPTAATTAAMVTMVRL